MLRRIWREGLEGGSPRARRASDVSEHFATEGRPRAAVAFLGLLFSATFAARLQHFSERCRGVERYDSAGMIATRSPVLRLRPGRLGLSRGLKWQKLKTLTCSPRSKVLSMPLKNASTKSLASRPFRPLSRTRCRQGLTRESLRHMLLGVVGVVGSQLTDRAANRNAPPRDLCEALQPASEALRSRA